MTRFWWRFVRAVSRLLVRGYYRSVRVEGSERIPGEGPVLLVANHPNTLIDPAVILLAVGRPVRFGAKGPLFRVPVLGGLLRRMGALPIERPKDRGSNVRGNMNILARFGEALAAGEVCAIFPEGQSHSDPELKEVRSGPARVALDAEAESGGELGVQVVPVGLSFHPVQRFRGEVVVRVGEPFGVKDLLEGNRHRAIREIQDRMAKSLRPLIHHLDRTDLEPMVEAIADAFVEHRRAHPAETVSQPRERVVQLTGACLNHYLVTDPAAVDEVRRRLHAYDRWSGRTGVSSEAILIRERPVRAFFAFLGIVTLLLMGLPVWLFGVVTGFLPYRATDRVSRALVRRRGEDVALPFTRILVGLVLFGAWWGWLGWMFHGWSESTTVTAIFAAALAGSGLFARYYTARARSLRERALSLIPLFRRGRAVSRAAELRAELLTLLQALGARYEVESGTVLLPPEHQRFRRRIPRGRVAAVVLVGFLAWFLAGLRGTALDALEREPSPWETMDVQSAQLSVASDAARLARVLETLRRLESEMDEIRGGFDSGERDFYSPEDNAAIRTALRGYLSCRKELLRILWFYRHADSTGPEDLRDRGWLLAYVSSVELASRGMQLVDAFDGHPDAVKKLNEGDTAWGVPPGVYDDIRRNLSDSDLLDLLVEASEEFKQRDAMQRIPAAEPWVSFREHGARGTVVVERLGDRLWSYKWDSAVKRAKSTGNRGRYSAASRISTWVGDARIRSRPGGHGLIRPRQLEKLSGLLEPGDVLIERRNWYLSNAFLPGFWPHAAIYIGGQDGVRTLGIQNDPRVTKDGHFERLGQRDHEGHERVVIEAISEGVVFTSLEESIGGADAVCVLRPRLSKEEIAEAVARAISHEGKPYDFDFDFFSTDRLVCTEVVYQAYQESVEFELPEIMGRRALPALDIVARWAREQGRADATFDLIHFLDSDEQNGVAVEAGAKELVASLDRPGMTLLHKGRGGLPLLLSPMPMALLAMLGAALFLFPRSTRRRKDGVTKAARDR